MSKVYVACHGSHREGTIQVPKGLRIHFYADPFEAGLTPNEIAAVTLTTGRHVYDGNLPREVQVANYSLSELQDDEIAERLASLPSFMSGKFYILHSNNLPEIPSGILTIPFRMTSLHGLLEWLAAHEPHMQDLHLLNCRTEKRSRGIHTDTVAFAKEARWDYDDRDAPEDYTRDHFSPEDDRFIPNLVRKRQDYAERVEFDAQGVLSDVEQLPQATQATLSGAGLASDLTSAWADCQGPEWPETQEDIERYFEKGSDFFPKAVWGGLGAPPVNFFDAWKILDWRNAFFFYIHGPARVDAIVKTRLALWCLIQIYLGEDDVAYFLDESGEWYQAQRVLDTEILAYAAGDRGPQPGMDAELLARLDAEIGRVSRLEVAKSREGTGEYTLTLENLTNGDPKLVATFGLDFVLFQARETLRNIVRQLSDSAYTGAQLDAHWDEFSRFLEDRWRRSNGDF